MVLDPKKKKDGKTDDQKVKDKDKELADKGFLEEDDDFEEFLPDGIYFNKIIFSFLKLFILDYQSELDTEEVHTVNIWEDDWDDDNIEDDFSEQLKYGVNFFL